MSGGKKTGKKLPLDKNLPDTFFGSESTSTEANEALMKNIYRLETDLDSEKEDRKEERFNWICLSALLLDAVIIRSIDGSWLFVLLFMLQIILLLGMAQRLGVDWAVKTLGWFLHWISEKAKLK